MSKYYRVRTQEQWEWLVNRFGQPETQWPEQGMHFGEICECLASGGSVIVHYDYFPSVGSVLYTTTPQNNGNVIEVSDLMEESKMKDYVTISRDNLDHVRFIENNSGFAEHNKISNVRELRIPKSLLYPKVRMSVAEKKEFDRLKENALSLRFAFDELKSEHGNYPKLCERLFNNTLDVEDSKAQNDFARAWSDESLIEVIPDRKWKVKVPRSDESYYFKDKIDGKAYLITVSVEPKNTNGALFTDEELKQFGLDDNFFEKVEVKDD